MDTKKSSFWWMKKTPEEKNSNKDLVVVVPKLDLTGLSNNSSASLDHVSFNKKPSLSSASSISPKEIDAEVDIGSILEEINRVAAQSPLGPFEKSVGDRSIDDIMKEAEKIYMESSKSFEQLSQISKTSQNISEISSNKSDCLSTPTPKSVSPLPLDFVAAEDKPDDYSSDFSEDLSQSDDSSKSSSKVEKMYEAIGAELSNKNLKTNAETTINDNNSSSSNNSKAKTAKSISLVDQRSFKIPLNPATSVQKSASKENINATEEKLKYSYQPYSEHNKEISNLNQEIEERDKLVQTLEQNNLTLKNDVETLQIELKKTRMEIELLGSKFSAKTAANNNKSPEISRELENAFENLKDTKELNTSLQFQLDSANKSYQFLKSSYDDLLASNQQLEHKVLELDATLEKYKLELINAQETKTKLLDNEIHLKKLLEIEKLQCKSLKLQNDKDSKCIQDLNRQIKEMERIIARKHPDSVSALIVAAKEDPCITNLTARKLLEDRIKTLEQEVANRDTQSSKVFLEIQDKFNQMKIKYESHIEDLELHVSDLKTQLTSRKDTFDVYTQTFFLDRKISPQKESFTKSSQTEVMKLTTTKTTPLKRLAAATEKEETHLLATIRGLQTDLANKEKVQLKLNKEIEEIRKTNRRLQKEREGSLRNLSDRNKDFRSYPEKLATYSRSGSEQDVRKELQELHQIKLDRDRLKVQLSKLQNEYDSLKKKRIDDLTTLQEAHEIEIDNYVASLVPLKEQLELQRVSIGTLQNQLIKAKEELAVAKVERDHLTTKCVRQGGAAGDGAFEADALLKKISLMEKHYEEREYRLKAIVQNLAQKSVITNRSCEQCAERQQQLIGYKIELDELLASVRALK